MIISDKLELCKLLAEVDADAEYEIENLISNFLDKFGSKNELKLDSFYDPKMKIFRSNY